MNAFALPATPATDIATYLRELEQSAPKTTPKDIRAALVQAAQELERCHTLAESVARQLDEVANVRISEMASTSAVNEIQRGIKRTLTEAARRLREKL